MELTPFKNIPIRFVRKCLTEYQKEHTQFKWFIKMAMDNRTGNLSELYEDLAEEMPLSVHSIRKLAEAL